MADDFTFSSAGGVELFKDTLTWAKRRHLSTLKKKKKKEKEKKKREMKSKSQWQNAANYSLNISSVSK